MLRLHPTLLLVLLTLLSSPALSQSGMIEEQSGSHVYTVQAIADGNLLATRNGPDIRVVGRTELVLGPETRRGSRSLEVLAPGMSIRLVEGRRLPTGVIQAERLEVVPK